jgi:hypothetical protein
VTEIQPFTFPTTGQAVRTLLVDGEPWFVAADVAAALPGADVRGSAGRVTVQAEAAVGKYSKERALALLGPELMAAIAASVAAAPPPSPEKVAELRRLFSAVPLPTQTP